MDVAEGQKLFGLLADLVRVLGHETAADALDRAATVTVEPSKPTLESKMDSQS